MKKLGKIMDELGFDKNGSIETQKAFIKSLIRMAQDQENTYFSEKVRHISDRMDSKSTKVKEPPAVSAKQLSIFSLLESDKKSS